MEQQEVFDRVVTLISPYAKNKDALAKASSQTRIMEDLAVNSARLVDIILAFEDEFDISVDDAAADKIRTIGDAVTLIGARAG